MARETIPYIVFHQRWLKFFGCHTSASGDLYIGVLEATTPNNGGVVVLYVPNHLVVYTANVFSPTVVALLHPVTPPQIIIDALLEVPEKSWDMVKCSDPDRNEISVQIIRAALEAVALMDIVDASSPLTAPL